MAGPGSASDDGYWFLGYIQGIVAVGLGIFALVSDSSFQHLVGVLLAIYLLIAGLIQLVRGHEARRITGNALGFYRGIVGMVIGGVLLAMALFDIGSITLGFTIIAVGLIVFGAMGLWIAFTAPGGKSLQWGTIATNAALVVMGVLVFVDRHQEWDLQTIVGWILVVVGAVILVWTYLTKDEEETLAAIP